MVGSGAKADSVKDLINAMMAVVPECGGQVGPHTTRRMQRQSQVVQHGGSLEDIGCLKFAANSQARDGLFGQAMDVTGSPVACLEDNPAGAGPHLAGDHV